MSVAQIDAGAGNSAGRLAGWLERLPLPAPTRALIWLELGSLDQLRRFLLMTVIWSTLVGLAMTPFWGMPATVEAFATLFLISMFALGFAVSLASQQHQPGRATDFTVFADLENRRIEQQESFLQHLPVDPRHVYGVRLILTWSLLAVLFLLSLACAHLPALVVSGGRLLPTPPELQFVTNSWAGRLGGLGTVLLVFTAVLGTLQRRPQLVWAFRYLPVIVSLAVALVARAVGVMSSQWRLPDELLLSWLALPVVAWLMRPPRAGFLPAKSRSPRRTRRRTAAPRYAGRRRSPLAVLTLHLLRTQVTGRLVSGVFLTVVMMFFFVPELPVAATPWVLLVGTQFLVLCFGPYLLAPLRGSGDEFLTALPLARRDLLRARYTATAIACALIGGGPWLVFWLRSLVAAVVPPDLTAPGTVLASVLGAAQPLNLEVTLYVMPSLAVAIATVLHQALPAPLPGARPDSPWALLIGGLLPFALITFLRQGALVQWLGSVGPWINAGVLLIWARSILRSAWREGLSEEALPEPRRRSTLPAWAGVVPGLLLAVLTIALRFPVHYGDQVAATYAAGSQDRDTFLAQFEPVLEKRDTRSLLRADWQLQCAALLPAEADCSNQWAARQSVLELDHPDDWQAHSARHDAFREHPGRPAELDRKPWPWPEDHYAHSPHDIPTFLARYERARRAGNGIEGALWFARSAHSYETWLQRRDDVEPRLPASWRADLLR